MKLKMRLTIGVLIIAIIPLVIFTLLSNYLHFVKKSELIDEHIDDYINDEIDELSSKLDNLTNISQKISNNYYVREYCNEKHKGDKGFIDAKLNSSFEKCIRTSMEQDNCLEAIILLNNYDEVIYSNSSINDSIIVDYYNKDVIVPSQVKFIKDASIFSTPLIYNVINIDNLNDYTVGKLIVVSNINGIKDALNKKSFMYSMSMALVDNDNMLLTPPYDSIVYINDNTSFKEANINVKDTHLYNQEKVKINNGDKKDYIGVYKLEKYRLFLVNMYDVEDYNNCVSSDKYINNIVLCILIGVLFVTTVIYVLVFTHPVTQIIKQVEKLRSGEKNYKVTIKRNDEFALLANTISDLYKNITESEERYRTVVEMTDDIVFEYNIKTNKVTFSDNFNVKFGFKPKDDTFEESFFSKGPIHKDEVPEYMRNIMHAFYESSVVFGEYRFENINGEYIWMLIRAVLLYDSEDEPLRYIGILVDIDRAKKAELNLVEKANYDGLTKLLNRDTFIKRLNNEYELSIMRRTTNVVVFIDLDDFKKYNDEYGHACGDEVLTFVANKILKLVKGNGFAGRYGGDEFVICLNVNKSWIEAEIFAKQLIKELNAGFYSTNSLLNMSINCSIGLAILNSTKNNIDTVIEQADEAMYTVKKHGKSNYAFYRKI